MHFGNGFQQRSSEAELINGFHHCRMWTEKLVSKELDIHSLRDHYSEIYLTNNYCPVQNSYLSHAKDIGSKVQMVVHVVRWLMGNNQNWCVKDFLM